jgi:hypothetical protein
MKSYADPRARLLILRPDLGEIMVLAKAGLAGQTMQLANGSWLPDPVAGTLAAYDTSAAPPAAARLASATVTVGTASGAVSSGSVTVPGAGGPGGLGLPPTTPRAAGPVPPPRRRGLKRPGVIVPAVLVVLLAAIGAGAYLGFDLKGNSSPQAAGTTTPVAKASAPSSPAASTPSASPAASASLSTSPTASAPGAVSASTSASAAVNSSTYSTPEPFPLCDPAGG